MLLARDPIIKYRWQETYTRRISKGKIKRITFVYSLRDLASGSFFIAVNVVSLRRGSQAIRSGRRSQLMRFAIVHCLPLDTLRRYARRNGINGSTLATLSFAGVYANQTLAILVRATTLDNFDITIFRPASRINTNRLHLVIAQPTWNLRCDKISPIFTANRAARDHGGGDLPCDLDG